MRFYLDEDLSARVATLARAQGLDVVSCHECGRDRLPDGQQLRLAAEDGRCMVTRNARDFVPLARTFAERQWPHAGLLIVARSLLLLRDVRRAAATNGLRFEPEVERVAACSSAETARFLRGLLGEG